MDLTEKPQEQQKFQVSLIYLLPILASIIFGLGCASLLMTPQAQVIPVTPFPEDTASGPFSNALYFVVLVAISATVFYFLLKRKNVKIIKLMIGVAMTTASILLCLIYLSALAITIPALNDFIIPLTIVITVLFDLAIFKFVKARNAAVICIGGALGVFFGAAIPWLSAVLILAFLAVYDVFAVYRGPVGKIAQTGLDQLSGLSYSFKDIQMGLGDLVFYSMLTGVILFNFGYLPCVVCIVGVLVGSIVTFFMLEKKGIFPGLPFPIMFGLAGGLITGFLI